VIDCHSTDDITIHTNQGGLYDFGSFHMMIVVELRGEHKVMIDDYVLSFHPTYLLEAEDLRWPLSYGS